MRKDRARRAILYWVCQFTLGNSHKQVWEYTDNPSPGDLVALKSHNHTSWYLAWVLEPEKGVDQPGTNDYTYQRTLESVETGEIVNWSNVSFQRFTDKEALEMNPDWRWTDEQFKFWDKWRKVCSKIDGYFVIPLKPIFDAHSNRVTLPTRIRYGLGTAPKAETVENWKRVSKKRLAEIYTAYKAEYDKPRAKREDAQ